MPRQLLMRAKSTRGLPISYAAEHVSESMVEHRRTNRYRRVLEQMLRNVEKMHPKTSIVDRIQR